MREDLVKLSLMELKDLAKKNGLKGVSSLRKPELIERLSELEKASGAEGNKAEVPASGMTPAESEEKSRAARSKAETEEAPARIKVDAAEAPEKAEASRDARTSSTQAKPARKNYTTSFRPTNISGRASFGRQENYAENRTAYSRESRNNYRNNNEGAEGKNSYRNSSEGAEVRNSYRNNNEGAEGRLGSRNNNEAGEQKNSSRGNNEIGDSRNAYRGSSNEVGDSRSSYRNNEVQEARSPYRAPAQEIRMDEVDLGGAALPPGVEDIGALDSGENAYGILEVMQDGFGFIRCANYMPGENDVYVSPSQIRRFNMKTGDIVNGAIRIRTGNEKFAALLYVKSINGEHPSVAEHRKNFEDLTPIFPNYRLHLETPGCTPSMRMVDLFSPIGKGQRGMIVSPPKAGKTTLLKQVASAITTNHSDMHLIILLIDERPEEVTDIKESIEGRNVEVIYSTFDEQPEHHRRVSEMVLGRAKRLVEHGHDVVILLDSITRLARAYNLVVSPSGRTLSGGLDPAALYMPKKFFGAARNMREGGSLTILATALVDTGSRMDDVVFEEFKGTGNMELVLDRKLSEKRVFPAIDLLKSGTRRDDLLLTREESEAIEFVRKAVGNMKPEEATEKIIDLFLRTKNNREFIQMAKKIRW